MLGSRHGLHINERKISEENNDINKKLWEISQKYISFPLHVPLRASQTVNSDLQIYYPSSDNTRNLIKHLSEFKQYFY